MRTERLILLILAIACDLIAPPFVNATSGGTPGSRDSVSGGESLDTLYAKAKEAISQNAYETAVRILTEARARFPEAAKIDLTLGDLYYDKELYTLALDEYLSAEKKGADDFATLTQISRSYGKLNREKDSIEYLTRMRERYPDSVETIDDLAWMYFKTHQLEKGEDVLLKGIARLGLQRGMAMTLGTVYSGMNLYDKSRQYYLKSIDQALGAGDSGFAAIAYYNLSLLERGFFHYNSALRYTEESIAMEDRSSGHLARGELFQARMDYPSTVAEYQKAYVKDTTPLAKVNLSILHQKFGHLELARRYAEEVLAAKDMAWMLYYGTDLSRHFKDVSEILADVYEGLWRLEAGKPTAGPVQRVSALLSSLRYRLLSWYYRQRFRLLSLKVGAGYLAEGSLEDAYWEFYKGNEAYPEVALKYLGLARSLETARTPQAEYFYLQEEGKVRHSAKLLEDSLAGFDQFWERDAIADSLRFLIPLLRGSGVAAQRRDRIVQLFQINPGALLQSGFGLPLVVDFQASGLSRREKSLILRYLKRAGSECAEAPAEGFRHTLRILRENDGNERWVVLDSLSGIVIAEGLRPIQGRPKPLSAGLVQAILDELYAVR